MTIQTNLSRNAARVASAALLGAAMLLPISAMAADGEKTKVSATAYGETVTVTVPMAMLETEEGAAKLYSALDRRAEKSCKTTIPQKIGRSVSKNRCKTDLMNDFVNEIDHATLTSLHQKA